MKLKKLDVDKHGVGFVVLEPEETEDLWHVYNLIVQGDHVRTTTVRKIVNVGVTGSTTTKDRKRITLTIEVDKVDFDAIDANLRLSGRNVEENEWVKMGAAHTVQIELHKQFTLRKEYWDPISLERVHDACDVTKRAEVAALMIDEGLANILLITESMLIARAHINVPIPKKRKQSQSGHDKALDKFFGVVYDSLCNNINFDVVKCVIIAGPGFIKEQFSKFLFARAVQLNVRNIIENKSKFMLATSSSAHKYSLKEVLSDKQVLEKVQDTKAAREMQTLNRFYSILQAEPDRATYGLSSILKANTQNAVEILMVSDNLFRSNDIKTRKQYVQLAESVKENGGEVRIFSSLHVSGEQLSKFAGVASILRFPVADLDQDDEEDSDDDSDDNTAVGTNNVPKTDVNLETLNESEEDEEEPTPTQPVNSSRIPQSAVTEDMFDL